MQPNNFVRRLDMTSESKAVPKERVVLFMSSEQMELAERLAAQLGWDVPEVNRMAHQLGLNVIAESNNKALVNRKLGLKGEIAKLLESMDTSSMEKAIAYLKELAD